MLNLTKAFELYEILAPYLPEKIGEDEMLITYAKHIIENMKGKDERAYTKALVILTGLSRYELVKFSVSELFDTFIMKLSENKILELQQFMKEINHGR